MIIDLPELKLQGMDLVDVYTHRATVSPGSDWIKEAFFGGKLLDLAITHHWLAKVSLDEIVDKLENFLEDDLLRQCVEKYDLERKLARPVESTAVGIPECRDFLSINAAKLWKQGGMSLVQGWISTLIEPGSIPPQVPQAMSLGSRTELPSGGSRFSSPELHASGSHVAASVLANETDPLGFVTLQIFNEHASQKMKLAVSWNLTSSGDAHCLLWRAECFLDGQVRGVGQGPSKKTAQEKAARDAWRFMGWSSPHLSPAQSPPESPTVAFGPSSESSLPPAYSSSNASLEWLTLSIFKHVVNQHRFNVEWRQERSGESHAPTWHVTCILDGQERGSGIGRNTKDAQLIAARNAWMNLGWSRTPT